MGQIIPGITPWKKIISYFKDVVIDMENSPFNGEMAVILRKNRLLLTSENAIYSWDDLYHNFYRAFEHIGKEKIRSWDNVLVLGLGLGSIPYMLEKKFSAACSFTFVEIDNAVIELAEYYSLPRLSSAYEIHNEDALEFISNCTEKYDCICVDIFQDHKIPVEFNSPEFISAIRGLLLPGGIAISNRLRSNDNENPDTPCYYEDVFSKAFASSEKLTLPYNNMLLGYNR